MRAAAHVPMDLGDIVSAAWFLCIRHWRQLLPMSFVTFFSRLTADAGILSIAFRARGIIRLDIPVPPLPLELAPLLALGAMGMFYNQLALVRFSLETSVGDGARIASCYAWASRRFLPALGATLITSIVFAVGVITYVGIPVGIFFAVCWFFATQVCLAEGEGNALRALRRSRAVVKGRWWRTAAVLIGIALLGLLPSIAAETVHSNGYVVPLLLSAVATAIAAPFVAGAQTNLYLDLRGRKHESITLASGEPSEPVQ